MRRLSGILLLLGCAFGASAADTDSFRLSMQNIKATLSSMKGLTALLASDQALYQRFKAEKKKILDTNGRDTLSLTAGLMESSEPRIAAVYRRAGITPKDAGMTLETLLGVMMGDAMLGAAKTTADLPKGFVAENMAFYKQNKAEIMRALEELKQMGTAFRNDDDDEEGNESESEENEDDESASGDK